MNDNQGFTLLEMLVVITILSLAGMIVSIAIPRAAERVLLARAEAEIVKVLNDTHTQALQSASIRRVVFDLERRRFQIEGSQDWLNLPERTEVAIISARELGLPRYPAIVFLGDGTSSGAEVTLRNGEYTKRFRINWLTGIIDYAAL
ncbi:prepilin-type N-terminal cleavage/methylation domain-containing protein [Microvirga sp. G4-2]|uniref:prepilin-type N-terminal cleavage/methylation domain-containing protein n=1 Tax=Microvirga sp. G4-2 TaxID=3434467 RepID=UPI004043D5C4